MKRLIAAVLLALALATAAAAQQGEQPALVTPDPSAEWRETARERSQQSLVLFFTEQAALLMFLATFAFGGFAVRLRERLSARITRRWALRTTFIACVLAMLTAVAFPFDVARFLLARLYDIGRQPFVGWLGDYLLAFAVSMAILVPIGLLFYALLDRRPRTWWRWVALAALPLAVAAAFAVPIYQSLFNTFDPIDDRALAGRILELAARRGIPADEVYEIDLSRQTRAPNAFVAGVGPTTVIALGDTLLDEFSDQEVLFVTAHEMGHYVEKHLWKGLLLGVLMTVVGAYLLQRLSRIAVTRYHERLRIDDLSDVASLPLILALAGALGFLGMPISNLASRYWEAEADRFALDLTVRSGEVSPEAAISTFERLGQLALSDPAPNAAVKYLLWSHPSLDERIESVRDYMRARR